MGSRGTAPRSCRSAGWRPPSRPLRLHGSGRGRHAPPGRSRAPRPVRSPSARSWRGSRKPSASTFAPSSGMRSFSADAPVTGALRRAELLQPRAGGGRHHHVLRDGVGRLQLGGHAQREGVRAAQLALREDAPSPSCSDTGPCSRASDSRVRRLVARARREGEDRRGLAGGRPSAPPRRRAARAGRSSSRPAAERQRVLEPAERGGAAGALHDRRHRVEARNGEEAGGVARRAAGERRHERGGPRSARRAQHVRGGAQARPPPPRPAR